VRNNLLSEVYAKEQRTEPNGAFAMHACPNHWVLS